VVFVSVFQRHFGTVSSVAQLKKFLGGRAKFRVSRVGQSPGGRCVVVSPETDDFAIIRCRILVTG